VRVDVPDDVWAARETLTRPPAIGWDAIPEGLVSRAGSSWLSAGLTALLVVPSVIIVEEENVLINPAHPDAKRVTASKLRRFVGSSTTTESDVSWYLGRS
jgi:RES domain-containing protein